MLEVGKSYTYIDVEQLLYNVHMCVALFSCNNIYEYKERSVHVCYMCHNMIMEKFHHIKNTETKNTIMISHNFELSSYNHIMRGMTIHYMIFNFHVTICEWSGLLLELCE